MLHFDCRFIRWWEHIWKWCFDTKSYCCDRKQMLPTGNANISKMISKDFLSFTKYVTLICVHGAVLYPIGNLEMEALFYFCHKCVTWVHKCRRLQ